MNINQATHTTSRGYLYRINTDESKWSQFRRLSRFETGVQFWDVHSETWMPSIITRKDLRKLTNESK